MLAGRSRTWPADKVEETAAVNHSSSPCSAPIHEVDWEKLIPAEQWAIYRCVLDKATNEGIPFALGGGLAVSIYTGRARNTKDIDLYIVPESRGRIVELMASCGLQDYYDKLPYDRDWIYRGNQGDVIVDAIWAMANKRAKVDEVWLTRGPVISMFDEEFPVVPPEELIWSKLYVM
ncbi:MAG TPA: nucleotidyl transferase AbiEii/AbiGii toxin family protein, partial [Bryobacteraceae bacterium]|nr:nucleotidyl transferase AbiEii/AbiGii toxin family protein [Bryobacteraceae bacterium]